MKLSPGSKGKLISMESNMSPDNIVLDIVIPVYNEGEAFLRVLDAFQKNIQTPYRVIVCYDNDDDTTLKAILKRDYSQNPRITLVKNNRKGAHSAVMTAISLSTAQAVITYMADDDDNAGLIDPLFREFKKGYEIVCPSRFIPGGMMQGCRFPKSFLVRTAARTLSHLGKLPIHDPTNGFKLFSRKTIDTISIESTQGFTYAIEYVAKAHRMGYPISEIPAKWYERSSGKSRFKVFSWAKSYLRWYFYIFATTYIAHQANHQ